jgi:hypothetical protein
MRLENWAIHEMGFTVIASGEIHNDEKGRYKNGERITTSPIVRTNNKSIFTRSGSKYELGRPSENYIKYCRENGLPIPSADTPLFTRREIAGGEGPGNNNKNKRI